jgi:hypothetical protein
VLPRRELARRVLPRRELARRVLPRRELARRERDAARRVLARRVGCGTSERTGGGAVVSYCEQRAASMLWYMGPSQSRQ